MKKHYNIEKNNGSYKNGMYCQNRKNHCINCGKETSPLAKRCNSCAKKEKLNPLYNKKIIFTKKHKKNMKLNHANFFGKNNPNYKDDKTNKVYYCIEPNCDNIVSGSNRRCIQCSNKGIYNSRFGKPMKPHFVHYKNIWFRSNWEMWFAQWLILSNIKWKYEPKTFDLGNTTYTPDFYLSKFDIYIEIKGYKSNIFNKKIKKFKCLYPNIKAQVLTQTELQRMGILQ